MTDEQQHKARALSYCTFLPGSSEKRFVRQIADYPPEKELSEKQAAWLDRLCYHYRKQLSKHVDKDVLAAWIVGPLEQIAAQAQEQERREVGDLRTWWTKEGERC